MTTFKGHFLGPGTHASRPSASGLPEGTMYVCTTHNKIEMVVSAAWTDYASLGTGTTPTTIANDTLWDAKGDLVAASAADTGGRLAVGSNDQVLVADSGQTLGVKWAAVPGTSALVPVSTIDAKGDLLVGTANDTLDNLPVGSNNQVLTADSAQTMGVKWATPAAGSVAADTIWDTKGDLAVASAADTAAKLAVGSNDQVLTADSGQTLGVKWATPAGGGGVTVLSYVEQSSSISLSSSGDETAATTIVTAAAVTCDGSTVVCVEYFCSEIRLAAVANSESRIVLYQDGSLIGRLAEFYAGNDAGGARHSCFVRRFLTPASGSRTFSIRGVSSGGAGTAQTGSGGSGGGTPLPSYIRVTSGG